MAQCSRTKLATALEPADYPIVGDQVGSRGGDIRWLGVGVVRFVELVADCVGGEVRAQATEVVMETGRSPASTTVIRGAPRATPASPAKCWMKRARPRCAATACRSARR